VKTFKGEGCEVVISSCGWNNNAKYISQYMSIMGAINLEVGCCIPGVVCTLSSWKTAEFSNTTNFHCCINGSSADKCYICIFSLAQITSVGVVPTFEHTSAILILSSLHKTIPARSWYQVVFKTFILARSSYWVYKEHPHKRSVCDLAKIFHTSQF
jgi:hypothetical protein